MTVHQAITMAEGLTEKAEQGDLRILRSVNGHEEIVVGRLETLVRPDDIIVTAEGRPFYVNGEIKTPGRYLYKHGLTVHKVITMPGGFTDKAAVRTHKSLAYRQEKRTIDSSQLGYCGPSGRYRRYPAQLLLEVK